MADKYNGLVHDRSWRAAYSADEAAELLLADVSAGTLPRDETRAILEATGQQTKKAVSVYPDGLTKREAEVLTLLARGMATKEIAGKLFIADKTADNHIQNIYKKIGKTSRAAAAVYALEHGLL